jgi:hypothetical protein
MSIAGIFALGGGCYDNDKHHRSSYKRDRHDKDDNYRSSSRYHHRSKCYDCDDDDDGLLGGLL